MAGGFSLTAKQAQCLAFLTDRIEATGIAPSYAEMQAHLGLTSKSGVHRLIAALEERGRIRRIPNRARCIEVLAYNPLATFSANDLRLELRRRGEAA